MHNFIIKVVAATVIGSVMAGAAYVITKALQNDDKIWEEPLEGTTKVEKLVFDKPSKN